MRLESAAADFSLSMGSILITHVLAVPPWKYDYEPKAVFACSPVLALDFGEFCCNHRPVHRASVGPGTG
jgi:hypothetical protein